jgi:filamentous hemagglutinin family protein
MNHTYRLVWNEAAQRYVPASELTRCHGKKGGRAVLVRYALLLAAAVLAAGAGRAHAAPAGGTVVAGQGTINQTGDTTTVRQQSQNLSLDWQSFNIARSETVQFLQPSSTAVAVNRVIGSDPSHIYGHLSANGQVFLLNPNGVLFGRTAQVNVGSLVASTLNLTDSDILTGHYTFQSANSGSGAPAAPASVINRGTITASDGGSVALVGGRVSNQGVISARFGTVALAAGSAITLDFNGNHLLNVQVDQGTAGALAENRQLIQADGGRVIMTAAARDALLNTVVNNTGVIEARTIQNQGGEISLLGGADGGTVSVDGTLDASAPEGGNGGMIETSGAHVHVADSARISTLATSGKTGTWLVDPNDFTIAPGSADISGAQLSTQLQSNNVILSSTDGKVAGNGDLFVDDVVNWSANHTLTLNADRNIVINSSMAATGNNAGLVLNYAKAGNGGNYSLNYGSTVTLSGSNPSLQIQGIAYTVINSLGVAGDTSPTTLQGIANAPNGLSGHYALGSDINATTTPTWTSTNGFKPIGAAGAAFTGQFHGLGHSISGLTVSPTGQAGLFGYADTGSVIRDVGLVNGTLASTSDNVGALAGENFGTISNSFASMVVTGHGNVGGLVGLNGAGGTITNSHTVPGPGSVPGSVQGSNAAIGGLVGTNQGAITNSYSTQQVSTTSTAISKSAVGGLVGHNFGTISQSHHDTGAVSSAGGDVGGLAGENDTGGTITGSYASGDVTPGDYEAGGLVGRNDFGATITVSYYSNGTVNARSQADVGGLVGINNGTVDKTYSTGTVIGAQNVGGLVGGEGVVGTSTITNSYATGSVSGLKFTGGLIGDHYGHVSNCYAGGTVTGSGINVGGFIGYEDGPGKDTNNYWIPSATSGSAAVDYSLATKLTPAQAQQQSSYPGWDFSSVWRNYDGHTTPLLKALLTPLTITADNISTVYSASNFNVNGGALSNPTYSINGAVSSPNLFGDSSAYANDRNAGTYAPDVWSNQQGFDITFVNATLTISKKPLLVNGISVPDKVYDGTTAATLTGKATVTPLGPDKDVTVSGTGIGAFSDKNVGNGKAITISGYTLTGADASNYTVASFTGLTANITPRDLTITAGTSSKTYDGTIELGSSAPLPTVVGLQQGDTWGISEAYADKNVGIGKTVVIRFANIIDGNGGHNYNVTTVDNHNGTITPLNLPVTGVTAANKIYDATTAAILGGTASIKPIAGDAVTVSGIGAGVFSDKNVGNGKAVTITGYTLAGADASNYTIVQPTGVTANITPANLTVTGVTAASRVYDGKTDATLGGTATVTHLGTDTVAVSGTGTGVFADKNVGNGKAVIVSGYTLTGTDAGNYTLIQPTGVTADITKASLTITAGASSKTYDGTLAFGTPTEPLTVSGLQLGDGVGTSEGYADKNVGTGKTVLITFFNVTDGNGGNNYTVTTVDNHNGVITPANLTITGVTAANKIYDTTTAATLGGTPTVAPFGSDHVSVSGTGTGVFTDKNVGNGKAVTITGYTLAGADASNYSIVQPTGVTANITPANLTVTGVTAANRVYNAATDAALSGTAIVAPLGSDHVSVSGTGTGVFADKNVGNGKTVTVSGYTLTGTDASNYTVVQPTGITANITPADLTITAGANTKTYDGNTSIAIPQGTSTQGLQGSDGYSVVEAYADKNAGTGKTIAITSVTVNDGNGGHNYNVTTVDNHNGTITPASLTLGGITANDKIYDAGVTTTLSGTAIVKPIGSDQVTVGGTGVGAFADKNVGTNKAVTVSGYTLSGTDASNYRLAEPTNLTANITRANLAITGLAASDKVYDATTADTLIGAAKVTALGSDVVALGGTGVGAFGDKNVGNNKAVTVTGYTLTGTDGGNYTLVVPTNLTANITRANLAITGLAASDKVYDTTTADTLTGTAKVTALGSDVVALGGIGVGTFADKNVGNNKAVSVSGYTLTGTDAGNYTLVEPTGLSANITPASLMVTGVTANNKVYDATSAATLSGTAAVTALGKDSVTLNGTGVGAFANKNAGIGTAVSVRGYTISGTDASNYTLLEPTGLTANITPANLTVTGLAAISKVYDATTTAALSGTAAVTALGSDSVALSGTGVGTFADKNVGNAKAITVSGYTLKGPDANNYTLLEPTGLTANITPATLMVAGVAANNKVYDSTVAATLTGVATVTALGTDSVSVSGTGLGLFSDKNVGTGKTITVTGYALTGADAGNYRLSQPTGLTADITPRTVTIGGITADDKPYDGTTASTLNTTGATLAGEIAGDRLGVSATGTFTNWNAGINRTVVLSNLTLTGADSANYVLASTGNEASTTAKITPASLTITANDQTKVAGRANPALTVTYSGFVAGESASSLTTAPTVWTTATDTSPAGNYAINVSGADGPNYNITYVAGTLNVTGDPLGVTGNPGYVGAVAAAGAAGSVGTAGAAAATGPGAVSSTGQISTGSFLVDPTRSQKGSDSDESEIYDGMLDIDTPKKVTEALPIISLIVLDKGIRLPDGVE